MEVNNARHALLELESSLGRMLEEFTQNTELHVTDIVIDESPSGIKGHSVYLVRIDVGLYKKRHRNVIEVK